MFLQNRFAQHLHRHLLRERQIVGVSQSPLIVHRRVNRQLVVEAEMVVVQAVSGRDVNKPSARHIIDKAIARVELSGARAKRVLIFELAQMPAIEAPNNLVALPPALRRNRRQQQRRDDQLLLTNLHE